MRDRIGILVALAVLAMALSQTPLVMRLEENLGLAWLYGARGAEEPPSGAAIIAIDEASTFWLQRNSERLVSAAPGLHGCLGANAAARLVAMRSVNELPRDVFACLIDALARQEPPLMIFDVHFAVPQPQDPGLAAAMERAGNVLLLEWVSEQHRPAGDGPPLLLRRGPTSVLREAALGTVGFLVESAPGQVTTRYSTRIDAFPDLKVMPVEAHRRVSGSEPALAKRELFWLYGPPRTVSTWSLREVFEPGIGRPLDVRDRVVFIGGSSLGPDASRDSFPVPAFSRTLSGVELAATAYLNMRTGQRLTAPGNAGRAALAAAIAVALAGAALFAPRRLAIVAVLLLAVGIAGVTLALFHQGVWLPVAVPLLLGLPLAGLIGLERRLRFARRLTSSLLPRPLSEQMLDGGSATPQTHVASVMFADVAGSTGLAETYGPEVYTRILAQYYSTVSEAVDRNGGAVYKYEGDGILAIFTGRAANGDDACGACDAARCITATLPTEMAKSALPEIGVRIGIATGPIAVGMLSFGEHFSVSTMGDAVNRAHRLQEMGRDLMQEGGGSGVVTLIDDATASVARQDERQMRFRTTTILRGRSSPTDVYHLTA